MANKYFVAIFWTMLLLNSASAQFIIGKSSKILSSHAIIATRGDVMNESSLADLSNCELILTGRDQTLSTTSPLLLNALTIRAGGDKMVKGSWQVTTSLSFQNGFLVPASIGINPGKIIFSGNVQPVAHVNSYVRGQFFSRGAGSRVFPIGNNDGFFPAVLPDVKEGVTSIGIEVISADPHLQLSDGFNVLPDRYWRLISDNSVFPDARIGLSTNKTLNTFLPLELVTILSSPIQTATVLNIGQSTFDNNFLYSDLRILKSEAIYTLAVSSSVKLKIHNLITPNNDQENNSLFIEHIENYPFNTVTLADRWGSIVKKWTNFSNGDSNFDFTSLSAGNYICIVEIVFPEGRKQVAQMISLLK